MPPYKSGSGENAVRFAEYLVKNSYRVSLLTFINDRGLSNEDNTDISKTKLKLPRNNIFSKLWFRVLFCVRLPKILRNISVVYIVGPCPGYKLLILGAKLLKLKVIFRSSLLTYNDLIYLSSKHTTLSNYFSNRIISLIDLYIAINKEFEKIWHSLPYKKNKVLLSTQGVDSTVFYPPTKHENNFYRTSLNLPPIDIPIIISVGNVTLRKGYDKIFRSLSHINHNFLYIILGEYDLDSPNYFWVKKTKGVNLVELGKSLLKDKIQFMGYTENPDKYYKAADLFVGFSEVEGFPNSILEAMACGLPIIYGNLKGVTDWILFPDFSIVCDNENDLTNAVTKLLVDKNKRLSMGKKSGEFASSNFSFDIFLQKINNLL
jgi:glycosyltransferase involved in cell wall biosynthesis